MEMGIVPGKMADVAYIPCVDKALSKYVVITF